MGSEEKELDYLEGLQQFHVTKRTATMIMGNEEQSSDNLEGLELFLAIKTTAMVIVGGEGQTIQKVLRKVFDHT